MPLKWKGSLVSAHIITALSEDSQTLLICFISVQRNHNHLLGPVKPTGPFSTSNVFSLRPQSSTTPLQMSSVHTGYRCQQSSSWRTSLTNPHITVKCWVVLSNSTALPERSYWRWWKLSSTFTLTFYGRSFVLRTDHTALCWLFSFRLPEGQIARWLEHLQQYDFELSTGLDRIMAIQMPSLDDLVVTTFCEHCEQMENGVLYWIWENLAGNKQILQLLLPKKLRPQVLHALHNTETGGHFGMHKTFGQVWFYWCQGLVQILWFVSIEKRPAKKDLSTNGTI